MAMTKKTITPEDLRAKGYKPYTFSDWTLERACEFIRNNNCTCKLVPSYVGSMVGIIVHNGLEYHVFHRDMTPEERVKYADQMAIDKAKADNFSNKVHSRQIARMRRGRR